MKIYLDNGDGSILANGTAGHRLLIAVGPSADERFLARLWDSVAEGLRLRYAATEINGLRSDVSEDRKAGYRAAGMRKILAAVGSTARLAMATAQLAQRGTLTLISRLRHD